MYKNTLHINRLLIAMLWRFKALLRSDSLLLLIDCSHRHMQEIFKMTIYCNQYIHDISILNSQKTKLKESSLINRYGCIEIVDTSV